MTQTEIDRLLNRIRIKAPGCGDVVLDLDRIVDRALRKMPRQLPQQDRPGT